MSWIDVFTLICLLLYAVGTIMALAGLLGRNFRFKRCAFILTLAAFALHTLLLATDLASAPSTRGGFLPVLAWSLVAVGLLMWWRLRLALLLFLSAPAAMIILLTALLLRHPDPALPQMLNGPIFFLHLGSIFVGIGMMGVAAGAGCFFLWQERSIKAKAPIAGFRQDLPSLAALDRVNALATLVGFPFYSLGVLCGFAWAHVAWGSLFSGDPKEVMSLLIWVGYGVLFRQRQAQGWRGRKPAALAIALFAASLFSLLVVNTLFPTHHSFGA